MVQKVTIVKNYRNTETLRLMELSEVVRNIQSCVYQQEVDTLRSISFLAEMERQESAWLLKAASTSSRPSNTTSSMPS